MEPELKVHRLTQFKADEAGSFRATIATFNVVDKDGDVTEPGAFKVGQKVRIAAWGHAWGDLPVGMGTIGADDEKAWVEGQFFLETEHGKQTYLTVKALGDLQEWSYGYYVEEYSFGKFNDQHVRFLKLLNVVEASPVMIGAGEGTGTDRIKGGARLSLADHSETVLAAATELVKRVKSLADLRAKEGRTLSAANLTRLKEHHGTLVTLASDLGEFLAAVDAPKGGEDADTGDVLRLLAEIEHTEARLQGAA